MSKITSQEQENFDNLKSNVFPNAIQSNIIWNKHNFPNTANQNEEKFKAYGEEKIIIDTTLKLPQKRVPIFNKSKDDQEFLNNLSICQEIFHIA